MISFGIIKPPTPPSKWDIIPIHASDIGAFKRCRRYWDWSSPSRTNLRRKVHIFGINVPLWYGTGIHWSLEQYYNPEIRRDPVEAWLWWFELQWNGGVVYEDELDLSYDLHPQVVIGHPPSTFPDAASDTALAELPPYRYKVRGLRELHPDPNIDEFMELRELGRGMMTFYREYAEREDDFTVVSAESVFSIPLGFDAVDRREDSPNYGKSLEVHARGKRDAIIQRISNGKFGIYDHKTAAKIGEDYFTQLENNPQFSTYMWASMEEARIHDLPWKKVEWVCCNALRKVAPTPPHITTRGFPSLDRSKEGATAQMFMDLIKSDPALQLWYDHDTKAQDYYEYLLTEGDKMFIQRDYAYRNDSEIKATGEHIRMVAREMVSEPFIYPNPSSDFLCIKCQFRGPCLAADDGSDWKGLLADGYESNRDR
jgi:hypothetical protein